MRSKHERHKHIYIEKSAVAIYAVAILLVGIVLGVLVNQFFFKQNQAIIPDQEKKQVDTTKYSEKPEPNETAEPLGSNFFNGYETKAQGKDEDKESSKVYYVQKSGEGDYSSLSDCIIEAVKYPNSIVYVGPGTWDIIKELGSEYIESVSEAKRGIYLQNGIHIICSSRSNIVCKYTGSNDATREWLSVFNAGPGGFTLENAHIESDNIRYTIHDERGSDEDIYTNHYINCYFKHTNGFYVQCLGGGLGRDGHVIVEGCIFEGDTKESGTALLSWHNSGDGYWDDSDSKGAQSFLDIRGNYFNGYGTCEFINFGKSVRSTEILVHDNSLGAAIKLSTSDKTTNKVINLYQWNNEIR